jgi:hypothetical protein
LPGRVWASTKQAMSQAAGAGVASIPLADRNYRRITERLSPDDHVLYLARYSEQGDIWLLTLK